MQHSMEDKKKLRLLAAVVLIVLVVDQSVKFWIKTNLSIGEELYPLGVDWAVIHFVENPGMAFGLTFGGEYGKLALSLFRIIAVILLGFYLRWLYQERVASILLAGFGLILAGALGNIIDSAFYGLIFSESTYHGNPAILFPPDGGYAGFLHGKVVDMLYFPIAEGYFPDWFPLWSGEPYQFFRPVFNVADMAISLGVLLVLILHVFFSKRIHPMSAPAAVASESKEVVVEEAAPESEHSDEAVSETDEASSEPPLPTA
jgi:signal peptidase II